MTKIVNSWNEWDPLKRVVVGRPEGTQVFAPEPGAFSHQPEGGFPVGTWGKFPQEMVDAANEQMDNFVRILEKRGILVERVDVHPYLAEVRSFGTPDWTQLNFRGTNCPRDLFLPVGNEIMEASGCMRSRWFEYLCLRPLFERYFKEDPDFLWTAAPKPRLTDESYVKNFWFRFFASGMPEEEQRKHLEDWDFQLTEKEPMWDAAAAARCGKDIIWSAGAATNRAGLNWLQRYFGEKGIRVHEARWSATKPPYITGHIDVTFLPLRPGLAVHNPTRPMSEELAKLLKMNDWEVIEAAEPTHYYTHTIDLWGHPEHGPSWISMNTLSLGPNTVCVEAHELKYIDQLTKLGIEVVEVPYEKAEPFGGSLHCTTLDVYREGKCEDYFPRQIPGF
jgi:glycine amidinotransferase